MSLDALPYMAFLVLAEFTIGGLIVVYAAQLRGLVTPGFLKLGGISVLASGTLTAWVGFSLSAGPDVAGYPLDGRFLDPMRLAFAVLAPALAAYEYCVWHELKRGAWLLGGICSLVALSALAFTAAVFRVPAWGYVGVLLSLLAGGLSLGAVTMGMVLGHWYLVTPRLPERPLNELTLALVAVLLAQTLVVLINLVVPARIDPTAGAGNLAQNPAFWLRIGVGLLFPIILAIMAWRSSLIRGMMSATGLLYVATGAVLAGEALARGLQFTTAIPF